MFKKIDLLKKLEKTKNTEIQKKKKKKKKGGGGGGGGGKQTKTTHFGGVFL